MNHPLLESERKSLLLYIAGLILLLTFLLVWQVNQDPGLAREKRTVLDVPTEVIVYGREAAPAVEAALAAVVNIEQRFSPKVPASKVTLLNRSPGLIPFRAEEDSQALLGRARLLAGLTQGIYDPTSLPLSRCWGFDTDQPRVPADADLEEARGLVNWQDLVVTGGMMILKKEKMGLDLGGLDIGYAAEQAVAALKDRGVKHAFLRMGRTVALLGAGPDGRPWKISLPEFTPGETWGYLEVADAMLTTAGIGRRWFEQDGKRYHDLLDPRTGQPSDSGLSSVTVIGPSAMDATALATAAFILGPQEGLKLIAEQSGMDAVFVTDQNQVIATPGIQDRLTITDPRYQYKPQGDDGADL